MLAKEVSKYAAIAGVIATAIQTKQVQDLVSQLEAHEWIGAVVAGVAVVKYLSGQIGLGRGDDPTSPSLKGVIGPGTNRRDMLTVVESLNVRN